MIRSALHLRPAVSSTASAAARRAVSGNVVVIPISLNKNWGPRRGFIPSLLLQPVSSSSSSSVVVVRSSSSSSSSNPPPNGDKSSSSTSAGGAAAEGNTDPQSQELVLTPGEKVVVGTRLFFWAGALAFASVCGYYIVKELLPTKMSPNAVFDRATSTIRQNEEVKRRFGETFKTYGRDHGGHREGRRDFIEHTEYVDKDTDGSKRTRVRFNLEGQYGAAFAFAEVSDSMPSGEFVYILVQDKRNGTVITVVDNRSMLLARKMAGGSDEGRDVFARLLGTGSSSGGGSK
jgi:import inner membrane translocase subunit TIM21